MGFYDKHLGSNSKIGKGAKKVSNFAGGKGITDYASGKGSKGGVLKGVAMVGMTVAGGGPKAAAKVVAPRLLAETKMLRGLAQKAITGPNKAGAKKSIEMYFKNKKY